MLVGQRDKTQHRGQVQGFQNTHPTDVGRADRGWKGSAVGSGCGGRSGFSLDAAKVAPVLTAGGGSGAGSASARRAGQAPGFRQSGNWDKMRQAGGSGGTWLRFAGDAACTTECLNAERSFTRWVSLKPPGLFGGEGSVI